MTCFQLYLAKKIIKKNSLQDACIIVMTYFMNDKYQYYINELRKDNHHIIIIPINNSNKTGLILSFLKTYFKFVCTKTQNIYISSIENYFIHLLLTVIKFKNLYTYDDGLANLNYDGEYYKNKKLKFLKFGTQTIRDIAQSHYTIYPNELNILKSDKLIVLPLLDNTHTTSKPNKELRIFLGQPINLIKGGVSTANLEGLIKNVCDLEKINYYFPHPSEANKYQFIEYIETNKIFEDIIGELMSDNLVIIYTFFSSVVKNFSNQDGIKFYLIQNETLKNNFQHLYTKLLLDSDNVALLEI